MFFRKRNTLIVWGAVLLGVFGMYMLCMNESLKLAYGDTLVLICAVLFSGHILCCDHFVSRGNPIKISAVQFVTTAIISWIAAIITEAPSMDKIVSAAIPIIYCGIVSGGVGYTLQIVAQKHTEPTTASLLMSLESVFAVIAGALIIMLPEMLRSLRDYRMLIYAIVLIVMMLVTSNETLKLQLAKYSPAKFLKAKTAKKPQPEKKKKIRILHSI